LIAEGALGIDDYLGTLRLTVEKLYSMEQAREAFARSIQLTGMRRKLSWNLVRLLRG